MDTNPRINPTGAGFFSAVAEVWAVVDATSRVALHSGQTVEPSGISFPHFGQ